MNVNKIAVILIFKNINPNMFIKLMTGKYFVMVHNKINQQFKFLSGKFHRYFI